MTEKKADDFDASIEDETTVRVHSFPAPMPPPVFVDASDDFDLTKIAERSAEIEDEIVASKEESDLVEMFMIEAQRQTSRANMAEQELSYLKVVVEQLTGCHDLLVEELATQYRDAERVGWLDPGKVKKLKERIKELEKENAELRKKT